jgi:hypothetical protein
MSSLAFLAVLTLLGFIALGRMVRKKQISPGPWFRQGRALSGVAALAVFIVGVTALTRGYWLIGLALIGLALSLTGMVRGNFRFGRQAHQDCAPVNVDETTKRALDLLGLKSVPDRATILKAWRKKMKTAHPDQGGTTDYASKVNAARDYLLSKLKT